MTKATVVCPCCGNEVNIEAHSDDARHVTLTFSSECPQTKRLEGFLYGKTVDAYKEARMDALAGQGYSTSIIFKAAERTLSHATSPVPLAIVKAVEVEVGLAQAKDITIRVSKA